MSVKDIERAIAQLPKSELNELAAWLEDYRHHVWEKQIEDDVDSGRLDSLLSEAEAEYDFSGGVRGKYLQQHLAAKINAMTYKVVLHESEEGFAVSCPALPGCWSQGATEEEAIANIRDAIREYLDVIDERIREEHGRAVEVAA